ncbi:hypothetical protein [Robertkochia solimangrovi]|uniref:hypothetical protein n=1 Tax=Robertkochia solimangrovi TaxID=2213046 RepID=UPI0018EF84DB|nr:hypothetical protein [Robertkochia solimangrovi]
MSIKKITFAVFAIALLSTSLISCSPNSVADEDSLYQTHQGIDRNKIKIIPGA